MKKALFLALFMAGCSTLPRGRVPAVSNADLCGAGAQGILDLFIQESKIEESALDVWHARFGTLNSRQERILKGAVREGRFREIAEKFTENPAQSLFEKYKIFASGDPFERLRLALVAENGIDVQAAGMSDKARRLLLELTRNEFPGELELGRHALPGGQGRFPRFFPDLRERDPILQVIQVGDVSDLRASMRNGIASPARQQPVANLAAVETDLMRDPELFYEVASPSFAGAHFQNRYSPFVRASGDERWVHAQLKSQLSDLERGKTSGFTVYRAKGQMGVSVPHLNGGESFVFGGMIEADDLVEAVQFKKSLSGEIIISRIVRRSPDGALLSAPISLDEVLR